MKQSITESFDEINRLSTVTNRIDECSLDNKQLELAKFVVVEFSQLWDRSKAR